MVNIYNVLNHAKQLLSEKTHLLIVPIRYNLQYNINKRCLEKYTASGLHKILLNDKQ